MRRHLKEKQERKRNFSREDDEEESRDLAEKRSRDPAEARSEEDAMKIPGAYWKGGSAAADEKKSYAEAPAPAAKVVAPVTEEVVEKVAEEVAADDKQSDADEGVVKPENVAESASKDEELTSVELKSATKSLSEDHGTDFVQSADDILSAETEQPANIESNTESSRDDQTAISTMETASKTPAEDSFPKEESRTSVVKAVELESESVEPSEDSVSPLVNEIGSEERVIQESASTTESNITEINQDSVLVKSLETAGEQETVSVLKVGEVPTAGQAEESALSDKKDGIVAEEPAGKPIDLNSVSLKVHETVEIEPDEAIFSTENDRDQLTAKSDEEPMVAEKDVSAIESNTDSGQTQSRTDGDPLGDSEPEQSHVGRWRCHIL